MTQVLQTPDLTITRPKGFISDGEDWFSPMSETVLTTAMSCMSNLTSDCKNLLAFSKRWADQNALQARTRKSRNSERFDGDAWIGNTVLNGLIMSTAIAANQLDTEFAEIAPIIDWMYDRTDHFHHITTTNTKLGSVNNTGARNHALAATLPSTMLGAWLGSETLLNRGVERYKYALENMRQDGSFPTETRRGSRALHYTGLQLSYLVTIAEIARSQGVDLYGHANSNNQTIHDAVTFALDGWQDWDGKVYRYAKVNHNAPKSPKYAMSTYFEGAFGWLPAYRLRFPDHPNSTRTKDMLLDPSICSSKHVNGGYAGKWWCKQAGESQLTLAQMLLDHNVRPAIMNHMTGVNLACMLSETEKLFQ